MTGEIHRPIRTCLEAGVALTCLLVLVGATGCGKDASEDGASPSGGAGGSAAGGQEPGETGGEPTAGASSGGDATGGGSEAGGTGADAGGTSGGAGGGAAAGSSSGGRATGGASTGGKAPGGASSGGSATGGARATGGSTTGGAGGDTYDEDPLLAFPGARGFGARVTGGRGGRVIKVTTLAASGAGSLQAALDVDEPRIIVFAVSGVIEAGMIEVPYGDVTIAGQSAPGGGITIAGRLYAAYDASVGNMIVRHVRVRPEYDGSAGEQFDAIQFSLNHHFIFDHVSVSGGVDETVDLYSAQDATVQWSTIESSATSGHPEGLHNYGLINGPDGVRVSIHHNLFAHHRNRCPALANGPAEMINNVVYNVRHGFVHHNPASGPFNLIGNTFVTGSDDSLFPFFFDDENSSPAADLSYYLSDNWLDGTNSDCSEGELTDPWGQCDYDLYAPESLRADAQHDFSDSGDAYYPTDVHAASEAYQAVLDWAGAQPRDVIAARSAQETTDRTGEWGARIPSDLLEGLSPGSPPTDDDDDGMADDWETEHGLDPSDGTDHATEMDSGYTAIEEYLNELAAGLASY